MPFSIINTITSWFLKKRIHQIELFKKYPIEVQNEVLMSLIKNAENTEFGKNMILIILEIIKLFLKIFQFLIMKIFLNISKDQLKVKKIFFGTPK